VSYLGKTGNLVNLSSLKTNSGLSVIFLLVELLTLAELAALAGELLFIYTLAGLILAKLALASLTLKVGLISIEGLVKLIISLVVKPIFINGLALLALLNDSAKLPFMEFSSLRLFQTVVYKKSISFFLGI
jgi:hypothetical protein